MQLLSFVFRNEVVVFHLDNQNLTWTIRTKSIGCVMGDGTTLQTQDDKNKIAVLRI
jgi:hypothetical protein